VLLRAGLNDVKKRKNFLLPRTVASLGFQAVAYSK
jgi:hypothetical protein